MNPVKIEQRTNIQFMMKLGWKTDNINGDLRNVYGDKCSPKNNLQIFPRHSLMDEGKLKMMNRLADNQH